MARTREQGGFVFGAGVGIAAGAALAYWLDPLSGRRRRTLARDRALRAAHDAGDVIEKARRDLAHRARGIVAEVTAPLRDRGVDDATLVERVRARLGRACSHPHAVEVAACDGVVELRGPILERERRAVVAEVARVRGVGRVSDRLEAHARPDLSALQGGVARRRRFELMQASWSPGPRLLVAGVGAALVLRALQRRSLSAVAGGVAGALLLARASANLPLARVVGIGAGRRAIDVQKELRIDAPIEDVFAFFARFDNFPRFMTHIKAVRRIDERRWHWEVEGPAAMRFGWDAEVHVLVANELLGWRSLPGASVASSGIVRFVRDERGGTRLDIRLQYNPPGGAVGHAFARLFGADPKKEMDDDLMRLKSLIETGKARGREGTVTREELR